MLKKISLTVLLLCFFAHGKDSNGAWFGTFSKTSLNDSWSWWSEAQLRYSLDEGETAQFLYRTGGLYKLNEDHGFGLLYGFITANGVNEHRFTGQHTQVYYKSESLKFSSRTRLEFRNLEDNPDNSMRFRYLFRADISKYAIWNESFINLSEESWTGDRTYERNRFFVGRKAKFFNSKMEYGYLNQYVPRDSGSTTEHIAVLYLFM